MARTRAPKEAPAPITADQIQWDLVREFLAKVLPCRTPRTAYKIDYYLPLLLRAILLPPSTMESARRVHMRRRNNCMSSVLRVCFPADHPIWNYVELTE